MEKAATVMNEVQGIRKVLEEYLGNRKAGNVALEILKALQGETRHTHNGEVFFVHKDEEGKLVLTSKSSAKKNVQAILNSYLEEDEVQECLSQLMGENPVNPGYETIMVEGSEYYAGLMYHDPRNAKEKAFQKELKKAIETKVASFRVPVNDPSIGTDGKLQFASGFEPAVGYSYNELKKIAKENGVRIGTKNEYLVFLGAMICQLMADGWTEDDAWRAICEDSKALGHYENSVNAKGNFEKTGARKIAGKCDLANTYKVLARDEKTGGFWLAGGFYCINGDDHPLVALDLNGEYDWPHEFGVGWFVC